MGNSLKENWVEERLKEQKEVQELKQLAETTEIDLNNQN